MWLIIILSIILFILEVINIIGIFNNSKTKVFRLSFKVTIFLIIYTFIMVISILIIKNNIKDMVPLLILCIPLSFRNIKIKNEELVYAKKINYKGEVTKKEERSFNKAGLSFSKTSEKGIITWKDDLQSLFDNLHDARGLVDNYIKSITFVIVATLLLSLGYIIVLLNGFPINLSLTNALIIKLLIIITSRYIYPKLPYDTDLMIRKPRIENKLYNKQEIFLIVFQLLFMIFGLSIPFMFFMTGGINYDTCFLIMLITYLYMLFFYTLMMLTEKILLKNILYLFKNIYLVLYLILIVGCSLLLNNILKYISIRNYLACAIVALLSIIFYDFIKFARYTTIRKEVKNEVKNNKKVK